MKTVETKTYTLSTLALLRAHTLSKDLACIIKNKDNKKSHNMIHLLFEISQLSHNDHIITHNNLGSYALNNVCDYLSMLRLKLIHLSKRGPV